MLDYFGLIFEKSLEQVVIPCTVCIQGQDDLMLLFGWFKAKWVERWVLMLPDSVIIVKWIHPPVSKAVWVSDKQLWCSRVTV